MDIKELSPPSITPRCIASTGDVFNAKISSNNDRVPNGSRYSDPQPKCFRSVQWSTDGTTLVTHNEDQNIRSFVLPPDLLDPSHQPHALGPYTTITAPSAIHSVTLYPRWTLGDPSTTLILSSPVDLPVRLTNALSGSSVASYPIIDSKTEAYITPASVAFTVSGSHFIAGSKNRLSVFDTSQNGGEPIEYQMTAPSRTAKKLYGTEWGLSGIISALSIASDGLLAAGSWNRGVGLFANEGRGECIAAFSVQGQQEGAGVSQVLWSPCGRYLYVVERRSEGIHLYDVRVLGQKLGWLNGRKAEVQQRLGVEALMRQDGGGQELWAGGIDGAVRCWRDPHLVEGERGPDVGFEAHEDRVTDVAFHCSGSILATCSGQRVPTADLLDLDVGNSSSNPPGFDTGPEASTRSLSPLPKIPNKTQLDNSLKIWTA
ncbi:hypothetical protein LTR50_003157 [Elasticomyces elasticus]|nr:hypothetical protein LTR50_003157 [Elasticomyces elasticus]